MNVSTHQTKQYTQVFTETPLITRLGLTEGMKLILINHPSDYITTLGDLPEDCEIVTLTQNKAEMVQVFVKSLDELETLVPEAVKHMYSMSVLWISWYRDPSLTTLNDQSIKSFAHSLSLKDEKFTNIGSDWNGIMFRFKR